jgi:hypothetical protein
MGERLCGECKRPLPGPAYPFRYCPVCRSLYRIEERSDLACKDPFSQGPDPLAKRLRDGFELMDDSDHGDSEERLRGFGVSRKKTSYGVECKNNSCRKRIILARLTAGRYPCFFSENKSAPVACPVCGEEHVYDQSDMRQL